MKHTVPYAIAVSLTVLACAPAPEPGSQPAVEAAGSASAHIDVPATVRKNLGITFAKVESRRVAQTVRVPGVFELQPLARHEYRMVLPGRVELAVDQYQAVEPGDLLFHYQSTAWPELLHEVVLGEQAMDVASAEIEVWQAKIDEARERLALFDERVAALAQADFKKAELEVQAEELRASLPRLHADLRLAETRLTNARRTRGHALHRASKAAGIKEVDLEAEVEVGDLRVPNYLTIDWIEVRALDAGVVEALAVTNGAFVESPDLVLSTVDPDRVRFRAIALQADLPQLAGAREARIVPPPSPGIAPGSGVDAKMTVGLEAHPKERTFSVLATPKTSATWIRTGISAFLEIVVDATAEPRLAIPTTSDRPGRPRARLLPTQYEGPRPSRACRRGPGPQRRSLGRAAERCHAR